MSACRSCDAPIRWARTTKGELMPLDDEPVADGNVVLTGRHVSSKQGGTIPECRVEGCSALFDDGTARYVPHFATCPDAESWRRDRTEAAG